MTSADTSAASFDTAPPEEPRRWSLSRWLAPFAVGLALLSAFLTFVVLTGLTSIEPTPEVVRSFLLINAGTILLLVGIIIREVWQMIQARRRGRAAARLHVQIVGLFSIVAVLPAVLVAVVANVTIERGLDRLFSGPTKEVIQNSLIIARAYMQEHAQLIRGDIIGMANDVSRASLLFDRDRQSFLQLLTAGAAARNLPGAMIMGKDANPILSAETGGIPLAFAPPNPEFLKNVNENEPEIAVLPDQNLVAAVIRLRSFNDTFFLYVARQLDPRVVDQLKQTELSVAEYAQIESRRLGIQVAFALMFAVIALTILMASVLIGFNFANSLVAPIRRLMNAAHTVSTGNLHVQVPVHKSEGDLAQLGETFNKMTQELRSQRDELVNASDLIDSRRRFIEAVLSSASAGIIGVDASGSVGILNRSAEKLIGHAESETLGHPLSDVLPELDEMMKTAREGTQRLVQGQITITRDGQERNLSVRVSAEKTSQPRDSYIITLDDITELVSAQRTSAWGDVARRIAHEIKNPLTPIQLSAERIRRKFGKTITEDKDKQIFDQCTDTIVRQVDDIRRMVDEFSRFARMPKPVMEGEDVADTVRQAVFLMKVAHPELDIETEFREDPLRAQFDRRLISQAVTNIVKNATEAIEQVPPEELGRGRIDVVVSREGEDVLIDVVDNGIGLPKVARSRLLEPYVTTRAKGTGLGLAIVGRVLEDHGGRIELKDAADFREGQRGAWMRMRFAISGHPKKIEVAETAPAATAQDTKEPAGGTKEPAEKTNDSTKIEASTGN
ncbi:MULTISPECIES: PAS domain-containing sensor histidine kinase [unclassified Bradyrhizobium]|uniref:sensor histidine kinase n=1 Tax=unclassified Bradyrhizobium TaxID=2631580 RepID=UPI00247B2411|nr:MULTISPECIES: PAS domain-containing sensor histidine kinase [unclassified Bradyrhizobium]WGR67959.1 PAS domain-containing sensor histidine kinase [Bradyrhizobium sp. ISRA426]WGR80013.1 PAS domain-containing sensor histidine kinase [Bradyrhizobium sp. ISRA430]WGR83198.1 PAS domain-containing sensor histidine kinase [Bradyrhizobium sp. ISRA432]